MSKRQMVRIGCGSAYDGDRLDWAVDLARNGVVSYLGFDCLAEATMTFAQLRRVLDPAAGYADNLAPVVRDFGGSNTHAAVDTAVDLSRAGLGSYGS